MPATRPTNLTPDHRPPTTYLTKLPPHERPTPQDYVSGQRKRLAPIPVQQPGGDPWICRFCKAPNWGVEVTQMVPGSGWQRRRICRNCKRPMLDSQGQPMHTVEVPVPSGHKVMVVPEEGISGQGSVVSEEAGEHEAETRGAGDAEVSQSVAAAVDPASAEPPRFETQRERDERLRGKPPSPPPVQSQPDPPAIEAPPPKPKPAKPKAKKKRGKR